MLKTQQIQELRRRLEEIKTKRLADKGAGDFAKEIDNLISKEADSARQVVKDSPTSQAIRAISSRFQKVEREDPRIKRIISATKKADEATKKRMQSLSDKFSAELSSVLDEINLLDSRSQELTASEITRLEEMMQDMDDRFGVESQNLSSRDALLEAEVQRLGSDLAGMFEDITGIIDSNADDTARVVKTTDELRNEIEALERRIISRIATINGGGNMNRNIAVGGNQSVLSMYTDINLKAGNGVTITYAPNIATGFTDITIAANGSGTGIVREINTVAVNTAMGSTAGTDYVYLVTGTTTVTLPTAVNNENLYTIKNVGANTVTVDTTGGQTIDDGATVSLPVQYTSVDIISDGTNWKVT